VRGSRYHPGYGSYGLRSQHVIRDALADIADASHPLLVHCHAGMDRTGVLIAVVGYLCSVPRRALRTDYLASGGTTAPGRIEGLLDHLEALGGPSEVATRLELPESVLGRLRSRLRQEGT
jgi:protein-tyrosine phosphatase